MAELADKEASKERFATDKAPDTTELDAIDKHEPPSIALLTLCVELVTTEPPTDKDPLYVAPDDESEQVTMFPFAEIPLPNLAKALELTEEPINM